MAGATGVISNKNCKLNQNHNDIFINKKFSKLKAFIKQESSLTIDTHG